MYNDVGIGPVAMAAKAVTPKNPFLGFDRKLTSQDEKLLRN